MWNDSEFNSTFASPGGGTKDFKKNQIKYILPVTGETINLCTQVEGENSVFEYKHLKFHQISLVGFIRNVNKRNNDIAYIIDDMSTPQIEIRLQTDDNDDIENNENAQPQFVEGQYVKVFGILKSLQGQKYVQAFRILPISELNEVTYHILDCINSSIAYQSKNPNTGGGGGGEMDSDYSSGSNPLKNANLNGNYNQNNGGGGGGPSGGGLDSIHDQISNVIYQCKNPEGLHVKEIHAYFKHLSDSKLREILEFLSTEGHIYSTIDDEHFKSTSN